MRTDRAIADEALDFIAGRNTPIVAMMDRIIGCPHEEGIDYECPTCPPCAFWAGRDRWTGKLLT